MSARAVLLIDGAWGYPTDDPQPVMAEVADGAVRMTVYGTDDRMIFSLDDWAALAAFVAGQTKLATPARKEVGG